MPRLVTPSSSADWVASETVTLQLVRLVRCPPPGAELALWWIGGHAAALDSLEASGRGSGAVSSRGASYEVRGLLEGLVEGRGRSSTSAPAARAWRTSERPIFGASLGHQTKKEKTPSREREREREPKERKGEKIACESRRKSTRKNTSHVFSRKEGESLAASATAASVDEARAATLFHASDRLHERPAERCRGSIERIPS